MPLPEFMGRVLVKFGGGVITTKSTGEPDVKWGVIQSLVKSTINLVKQGHYLIVVHGAGSFGHVLAKRWDLSSGKETDAYRGESNLEQRMKAVTEVRKNMDWLCKIIVEEYDKCLQEEGLHILDSSHCVQVAKHTPREFMRNTGHDFDGDISRFIVGNDRTGHDLVHITHGDLVDCDEPKGFGILSGDHIMYRLATELPDVTHCIFAMDETGILTSPDEKGMLIPRWNRQMGLNGVHDAEIDVTGGIFLKADVAADIAEKVEHVWFIDGKIPNRIVEIVENGDTIGTRIVPS